MARESESGAAITATCEQTAQFLSSKMIAGEASDIEQVDYEGEMDETDMTSLRGIE